jgi:hypothetical protein
VLGADRRLGGGGGRPARSLRKTDAGGGPAARRIGRKAGARPGGRREAAGAGKGGEGAALAPGAAAAAGVVRRRFQGWWRLGGSVGERGGGNLIWLWYHIGILNPNPNRGWVMY